MITWIISQQLKPPFKMNRTVNLEELKDSATPAQIAFESSLDTLLHAFGDHFPECNHYESPFFRLYRIWTDEVQADLRANYSNL